MNKSIVTTAAILICLAIVLGAIGAHSVKKMVDSDGLDIFKTGVNYQMYMGLGLLAVGLNADKFVFQLKWFFRFGFGGVLIFSGLLYVLAFKEFHGLNFLGAIVPIGGTLMIVSWVILIYNLLRSPKTNS